MFPVVNPTVNCLENLYSLALVTSIKNWTSLLTDFETSSIFSDTGLKIAVVFHLVSTVLDCFSPATQ